MTTEFAHKEAFRLLADDEIGRGIARVVYSSKLLPDSVVKVENDACSFQNVAEWQVWQAVRYTEFARWLAPCEWISPCGGILIQKRTTPPSKLPPKLPVFLTDTKRDNYGIYKGKFVCHDYGLHCLMENGMSKRVRKVYWS